MTVSNGEGTNREGIDEDGLKRLVETFYTRVRADPELGPVFNDAIADWPAHLDKLAAFWSSVMLTSGRYKGNPMQAHMRHAALITPALFQRWLVLWGEVANEVMPPNIAATLRAKASRIAESLQYGMFFHFRPEREQTPAVST